jgi:hypothetical protein
MSQPRIRDMKSFPDVRYNIEEIHRQLSELRTWVNGELENKKLNLVDISCNTLTVKNQKDDAINNAGGITQKDYISQTTGYRITADGQIDCRYLYTDELHAKAFIADMEQALAGGQVICKSVAKLMNPFVLPTAGNTGRFVVEEFAGFSGNVFADGDIIRLRQMTRSSNTTVTVADAWGTVVFTRRRYWGNTLPLKMVQEYTFTRSSGASAGTASGIIAEGTLALDYGVTGQGYYEVTAIDGANGANSPYAQVVNWTTHPQSGCTVQARMGNLGGITSATWGALSGFGFYGNNIYLEGNCYIKGALTFTNQSSISISGFNNDSGFSTVQSFWTSTEPTVVTNGLKVGDFWFDTTAGTYRMKRCKTITPSVTWDNVGVYMDANGVYAGAITAGQVTAGTLTGFTIQTNATPTVNGIVLDNTSNGEVKFYVGSTNIVRIGGAVYSGLSGVGLLDGIVYSHNISNGGQPAIYGQASTTDGDGTGESS